MTKEDLLAQIEKLQRRWDYHAIEHRAKRENNNPQYNAYDHGADYLMYDAEALADTENRIGIQPYYEEVLRRFNDAKK